MKHNLNIPYSEIKAFCERYHIRRLSLFGSILRDDFGPESDIDVLVEFDSKAEVGFLMLSRMARELSALLGKHVDLVPRSGLKSAIRETILQEEKVIYAA